MSCTGISCAAAGCPPRRSTCLEASDCSSRCLFMQTNARTCALSLSTAVALLERVWLLRYLVALASESAMVAGVQDASRCGRRAKEERGRYIW
eukprot:scaffold100708_cov37-Tisochrysis_lutea.AAC.1